ncbi:MAG: diaminopimelate decarboxylase [Bacilli bacterium]|nr:diaminopimelate decarboxylase [Bacilli bacterium]
MSNKFLHDNLSSVGSNLYFAGVSVKELAMRYGTPLLVLDEGKMRSHINEYKDAMAKYFGKGSMPLYASKACSFKEIYRIVDSEEVGTDIVSPGELYTAVCAGFDMSKAFFHGNNKTDKDIAFAMDNGIGYFVCDGIEELDAIQREAAYREITQKILLRIAPGIDPHTHKKISTGGIDSKFGSAIATGLAETMVKEALARSNVELMGYHCHIGSQIFEVDPYIDAVDIMSEFIADMKAKFGFEAKVLNLGGGFGVRYVESDPTISITENIKQIGAQLDKKCAEYNLNKPIIYLEPGRSLVADAGLTIYEVGSVKEIKGVKNYVSIDGGMTDNPRFALYQSSYTVLAATHIGEEANFKCTLAGRCCESGDIIQEDIYLPKVTRGDIIAVLVTGAYNYSMSSNYNRVARPGVVIVRDGESRIAVKRETYDDLISLDL